MSETPETSQTTPDDLEQAGLPTEELAASEAAPEQNDGAPAVGLEAESAEPGTEAESAEPDAEGAAEAEAADAPAEASPAPEASASGSPTLETPEVETPAPAPAAEASASAAETPKVETPAPAPVPAPPAGVPAAPATPAAPAVKAPAEVPLDPVEFAAAAAFGRVDADGNVFVTEKAGERTVGQFPNAPEEEALTLYVRRYLDLVALVRLFESRIPLLSGRDLDTSLKSLQEQVTEPQAVGDLDGLRVRVSLLEERVAQRKSEIHAEREAARAEALVVREQIVAAAEEVAGQDVERTQWKDSGEHLHGLLDQWKSAQRSGPRLEKATEDALWKRFSKARTTFDRNRRQFFAERDAEHAGAKAAKEDLIARAEALSSSTDWGATAREYRDLMQEWKAAGRARRREDDALWARFRAAQQVFFDARDAQNQLIDEEYSANLVVKLEILEEAEALLPITDVRAARAKMRQLEERWDEAGRVPRADVQRVEGRMRAVDQAIKDLEDAEWRRSNPETQARVNSATSQLEAAITSLEEDLATATAKGDKKAIKNAEEALAARRSWLEQIQKSLS